MPTKVTFAAGEAGNAAVDWKEALDEALAAGDGDAHAWLQELVFKFLQEELGRRSQQDLQRHLSGLRVWRWEDPYPVFKTVGDPCVAYTALVFDGRVRILTLGFSYRLPGSEEEWWRSVILPRLRLYL